MLVIDDNPKIKEGFELAFPEYDFLWAASGEEGLKHLRKPNEIDLVMLDQRLGNTEGITVLKDIRAMGSNVGVMMLTNFGSKDLVVEALRNRAEDFIDKPFSVEEMRGKFEKYFERLDAEGKGAAVPSNSMRPVLRFIERNFKKDLTLEAVAKKAMLSPKYLSRKFKEKTRQTFSDYKIRLRVDRAKQLLHDTVLSVADIAYKVGYENAESLMKVFKKVSGCTPTEYRKRSSQGISGTGRTKGNGK